MTLKKIVKKYGNSLVLVLSPDEVKIIDLKEGDIVEIGIKNIETKEPEVLQND